ncbi:hypothetical protein SAY87_027416 [Trapa incisa]|uniref:Uncharacterized protein n=1 Tax=Trapa incisa TaxID=236973 RepID=A0AAN7H4M6_9MYRT|nr:hypothetical protein SAY87_027416 [Trapa incisa]
MSTTPTTTEVTQQDYTAHSGHGSVGPVIAVLAVITILGVIAGMIGRLCSGKTIMGRGQYDFEGWMERKFSSCIDGHVGAPPRRPPPPSPPPPQPPQQQPPDNQEEVEQSGREQRASGEDACCHDSNAIIYPENTHWYIYVSRTCWLAGNGPWEIPPIMNQKPLDLEFTPTLHPAKFLQVIKKHPSIPSAPLDFLNQATGAVSEDLEITLPP